jgi:hypothetical protein
MARRQPAPAPDLTELSAVICDAFETPDGNLIDQVYDTWYRVAREQGVTLTDERGDFLQHLEFAVNEVITAAIWFGITTGHQVIAGDSYHVPRRLMSWCGSAAGGWGGGSR